MRLLGKKDQMMSGVVLSLQYIRQREMNRLLRIVFYSRHTCQGASNRNMLEQPSAVLSSEHVRVIRIIDEHRNDVEWLRYRLL